MAGSGVLLLAFSWNMVALLLRQQDAVFTAVAAAQARLGPNMLYTLAMNFCSTATFPSSEHWGATVPYATSLAQLKTALTSSASHSLFDMSSAGSGNATVYGAYQCRGDLNSTECSTCISFAADSSANECPQAVNARIDLYACSFYYQNTAIVPSIQRLGDFHNSSTNASVAFHDARRRVLQNVSATAPSALHFYSSDSDDGVAYAFAQCFGYLSRDQCATCLASTAVAIDDDPHLRNATGAGVVYDSCMLCYDNVVFVNPTPIATAGPPRHVQSWWLIAIAVCCCFLLAIALCGFLAHRKRASNALSKYKRGKGFSELQESLQQHQIFLYLPQQLKEATKNFQESCRLGEGGFGSVFKGTLKDGQVIAIKKLTHPTQHGNRQFLAEVETVTTVQHRNLIRLLGCCLDSSDKYLVYEYMPNQSLDKHLFGKRTSTLPWSTRQNIILGTAKGLMYLHHESNVRIIHRDIKAANILLDENMEAKIADFGLAKLFASDQTHFSTALAGTIGYLAPEYTQHGQVSEKSDTYSFGVVVLEILSGRRVIDARLPPEQQGLLKWAWVLYEGGRPTDIMDPALKGEFAEEEVTRMIQLALLCTQVMADWRPTMSKVVAILEGDMTIAENPRRPEIVHQMFSNMNEAFINSRDSSASNPIPPFSFAELTIPR